jgi:hypothetical protein
MPQQDSNLTSDLRPLTSERLCLINPLRGPVPPDGYRYVDPEDGFLSHSYDYRTWIEQEAKHLEANGKPVPADLEAIMQEQLCLLLPPGWCSYDDPQRPRPSLALEWGDMMGGLKTFGKWIAQGCGFVPQAEAERRALICSRCYLNMNVVGCASCQKLVTETIGSRVTKYDYALKACGACKCMLRAKVHFPLDTLDTETQKLQEIYPEHCWLKKTGENYQPNA